jgi:glucose-6-phosphate 1-dehydrogenase
MSETHSDALVIFGTTGDLAYKKIFPALQAMVKRGHISVPVIGVARGAWSLEKLRARAHESLEEHGGVDPAAFEKLRGRIRQLRTRKISELRHKWPDEVSGWNSNACKARFRVPLNGQS